MPSIVFLSCGKSKDGSINTIGTGFGLANGPNDKKEAFIATCAHIADDIHHFRNLDQNRGKRENLIDNICRVEIYDNGKFTWKAVKDIIIGEAFEKNQNFSEIHDICICKIPGIEIPNLSLHPGNFDWQVKFASLDFLPLEIFKERLFSLLFLKQSLVVD